MKDSLIKFLDGTIFRCIVRFIELVYSSRQSGGIYNIDTYNTFLLIRPGGIGDAMLLYPLIYELYESGKIIDVLCMKRNKGVFDVYKKYGYINNIYCMDNIVDVVSIIVRKYDCILDTEQSFFASSVFGFFIRSRLLLGFDTNERRKIYDGFLAYRQDEYEAQSFLNLLKFFGIIKTFDPLEHCLSLEKVEGIDLDGSYACVFTGASASVRKWNNDRWREVIENISDSFDHIVFVGGLSESDDAREIITGLDSGKMIDYTGKADIERTMFILGRCRLFITTDSGPLHMATIIGAPKIVSIFGPGIQEKWGKYSDRVCLDLPCLGCNYGRFSQTPKCPYGYSCIQNIQAEKILSVINS